MSEQEAPTDRGIEELVSELGAQFLAIAAQRDYPYATALVIKGTEYAWDFHGGNEPYFGQRAADGSTSGVQGGREVKKESVAPICQVAIDEHTLQRLVEGRENPQRLYHEGTIEVKGDARAALPLVTLWGLT